MRHNLSQPPIEDWFWELLDSSERSLCALCRKLEAIPKEKLFQFQRQYTEAKDYVNPRDWDDPDIPSAVRSCGVGDEFGEWVVSQGKSFYYEVRSNPAQLQKYIDMFETSESGQGLAELRWDCEVDRADYRGWQSPAMIAFPIFEARFGRSMTAAMYRGSSDIP